MIAEAPKDVSDHVHPAPGGMDDIGMQDAVDSRSADRSVGARPFPSSGIDATAWMSELSGCDGLERHRRDAAVPRNRGLEFIGNPGAQCRDGHRP